MYTLQIPALRSSLPAVYAFAHAVAAEFDLPDYESYRLRLIIDEISINIINYGNAAGDQTRVIRYSFTDDGEALLLTIEDYGEPFDITAPVKLDIDTDLEDRRLGGLGIYLVQQYADDISYQRVADHNVNRVKIRHTRSAT